MHLVILVGTCVRLGVPNCSMRALEVKWIKWFLYPFFVCVRRCGNLLSGAGTYIVYTVKREQLWDKGTLKSFISEQIWYVLRFNTFSRDTSYKTMALLWVCGFYASAERSFKTKWVYTWTNAGNNDPPSDTNEAIIWSMNYINITGKNRLKSFLVVMPMYVSILPFQIKYVISKSHKVITYDLSRYIILFSDMNYLRLSLLGIWVKHFII